MFVKDKILIKSPLLTKKSLLRNYSKQPRKTMKDIVEELKALSPKAPHIPTIETFNFDQIDSQLFNLKTDNILSHFHHVERPHGFRQTSNISSSDESAYFFIQFLKKMQTYLVSLWVF